MKFIYQNIQDGIQFQMKLFTQMMKLKLVDNIKRSKTQNPQLSGLKKSLIFLNFLNGKNHCSNFMTKIQNLFYLKVGKNEVVSFVKSGLKDLSVSRKSFSWGIKVPSNDQHVIYVWLDALTNYLSALNYPDVKDKLFKDFWPASLHLIGKDILRFHAVYWPAFLLAANIPLPKRVYGHGWILSGEEKMSKSKGNILDPIEIIKKYGLDPLRYYLIKEVSFGNDGNISQEKLENCINSDLANNYGNLCQRVMAFIDKNLGSVIPDKIEFNERRFSNLR